MLKDCMTDVGFWKDDAQVVKETVEKRWSDEPTGISIEMDKLDKILKGG
jgi:Holliday junction resolvase RusA-like endonuclease